MGEAGNELGEAGNELGCNELGGDARIASCRPFPRLQTFPAQVYPDPIDNEGNHGGRGSTRPIRAARVEMLVELRERTALRRIAFIACCRVKNTSPRSSKQQLYPAKSASTKMSRVVPLPPSPGHDDQHLLHQGTAGGFVAAPGVFVEGGRGPPPAGDAGPSSALIVEPSGGRSSPEQSKISPAETLQNEALFFELTEHSRVKQQPFHTGQQFLHFTDAVFVMGELGISQAYGDMLAAQEVAGRNAVEPVAGAGGTASRSLPGGSPPAGSLPGATPLPAGAGGDHATPLPAGAGGDHSPSGVDSGAHGDSGPHGGGENRDSTPDNGGRLGAEPLSTASFSISEQGMIARCFRPALADDKSAMLGNTGQSVFLLCKSVDTTRCLAGAVETDAGAGGIFEVLAQT